MQFGRPLRRRTDVESGSVDDRKSDTGGIVGSDVGEAKRSGGSSVVRGGLESRGAISGAAKLIDPARAEGVSPSET